MRSRGTKGHRPSPPLPGTNSEARLLAPGRDRQNLRCLKPYGRKLDAFEQTQPKRFGGPVPGSAGKRESVKVPERGVEPLCPFGQTGLSRPRIPFRHPGQGPNDQSADQSAGECSRARSFCHSPPHGRSIKCQCP
jgi:hypothetical protein